jgi:hypothetical protein
VVNASGANLTPDRENDRIVVDGDIDLTGTINAYNYHDRNQYDDR